MTFIAENWGAVALATGIVAVVWGLLAISRNVSEIKRTDDDE